MAKPLLIGPYTKTDGNPDGWGTMSEGERTYRSDDGRTWTVTLEAPGALLGVDPELRNAGAMLPEEAVQLVFRSGEETLTEEYTGLSAVEDLSDDDLRGWFEAARRGRGM